MAPALVRRYGKGTDSDATDALVVGALSSSDGGVDDNDARAGALVVAEVAPTLKSAAGRGGNYGHEMPLVANTVRSHPRPGSNCDGAMVVQHVSEVAGPLLSQGADGRGNRLDAESAANGHYVVSEVAETLTSGSHPNSNAPGRRREDDQNLAVGFHNTQHPISSDELSPSIGRTTGGMGVAHRAFAKVHGANDPDDHETWDEADVARTLNGHEGGAARATTVVAAEVVVRRLSPVECERLMGWPDGWTIVEGWKPSRAAKPRTTSGTGSTGTSPQHSTPTHTAPATHPSSAIARRRRPMSTTGSSDGSAPT